MARRFALVLSVAFIATAALLAQGPMVRAAPNTITVKTGGLQVVYPTPRPGDANLPGALNVKTGGLSVVYAEARTTTGAPALKVTTSGLTVVYPTPKGK